MSRNNIKIIEAIMLKFLANILNLLYGLLKYFVTLCILQLVFRSEITYRPLSLYLSSTVKI